MEQQTRTPSYEKIVRVRTEIEQCYSSKQERLSCTSHAQLQHHGRLFGHGGVLMKSSYEVNKKLYFNYTH